MHHPSSLPTSAPRPLSATTSVTANGSDTGNEPRCACTKVKGKTTDALKVTSQRRVRSSASPGAKSQIGRASSTWSVAATIGSSENLLPGGKSTKPKRAYGPRAYGHWERHIKTSLSPIANPHGYRFVPQKEEKPAVAWMLRERRLPCISDQLPATRNANPLRRQPAFIGLKMLELQQAGNWWY